MMISLSAYLSSPSPRQKGLNLLLALVTKVENSLLLIQEGLSIYCSKYFFLPCSAFGHALHHILIVARHRR